jgi:hypothetical protein
MASGHRFIVHAARTFVLAPLGHGFVLRYAVLESALIPQNEMTLTLLLCVIR